MDNLPEIFNCESAYERQLVLAGCAPEVAYELARKITNKQIRILILDSQILQLKESIPNASKAFEKLRIAIKESNKSMVNLTEQMQEIKIDHKLKRDQNRKNWHWKGKGK